MRDLSYAVLRGAGKTKEAMFIFLISLCLFRIIWIGVAMAVKHSVDLLMMVYPTSWFLGAALSILYIWKGNWNSPVSGGT